MRVLLAMPDAERAAAYRRALEALPGWETSIVRDGREALRALETETYALAALHLCLPGLDGLAVLASLEAHAPVRPPKTLLLCERELLGAARPHADCAAPLHIRPAQLARLMQILSEKKRPLLSRGTEARRRALIDQTLSDIGMSRDLKGRQYAEWLLFRLAISPSPEDERLQDEYAACGVAHGAASAASVERCLRHAVERCFTTGDLQSLEAAFGATVDAERGKLTNRAFLLALTERLRVALEGERYSRIGSRSRNSSPMLHSPAAPTSV